MSTLKIGCKAKHRIKGIEGILTGFSENMSGMKQFGFTRTGTNKDGEEFAEKWYDHAQLEYVDEGMPEIVGEPVVTDHMLGTTVEHYTGFTGVVDEMVTYLNGCVYLGVLPRTEDPTKMPELQFKPCQTFKRVMVDAPEEVKVEKSDTGGPASQAPL